MKFSIEAGILLVGNGPEKQKSQRHRQRGIYRQERDERGGRLDQRMKERKREKETEKRERGGEKDRET